MEIFLKKMVLFSFLKILYSDESMKTAILSLQVSEDGQVEVRMQGEQSLDLSLLGGLDFAKDYVLNCLKSSKSRAEQPRPVRSETNINKSDALWFYLEKRKVIEARIQAINNASEKQTFLVDKDLLANL